MSESAGQNPPGDERPHLVGHSGQVGEAGPERVGLDDGAVEQRGEELDVLGAHCRRLRQPQIMGLEAPGHDAVR